MRCHCCATRPYRDPIPAHQGQERVPWRWGSVEGGWVCQRGDTQLNCFRNGTERKVSGRSVFGEAPGWAGQGCAPNHRAGQISAFDFFPVPCRLACFSPPHACSQAPGRLVSLSVSSSLLCDLVSSLPCRQESFLLFVPLLC